MFWLSIALLVGANVAYHVCQKLIPAQANPVVSVIITFMVATAASVALLPIFLPDGGVVAELRKLNWASVILGLTIIGIEVGFLLLYRSGMQISLASIFVNAMVALSLVPVGILLFKDRFLVTDMVGIGLLLAGIYLIAQR
jgi:drug/metabolite transporter (DMT)-like permease